MNKSIEIFKPGKQTPTSGQTINFTESIIAASVAAYDPALHEAPLVIGHPRTDDPAWGWVKSIAFADGVVTAECDDLDADFAEMVNSGKFKKRSASFYLPDSPNNPVPGVYYLRHVGFLGAQPPAVKGLKDVSFAQDEQGIVEFADWDQMSIASLFRRLREWIISKHGVEEADKTLPDWEINSLQTNAALDNDNRYPSFSEPNPKGDDMPPEDKARLAALEQENTALKAENATLKTQTAEFSEREKAARKAAAHTDNVNFVEGLVKEGKLLPASKDSTIALMDNLAEQDSAIEFGEGDGKQSKTSLQLYRDQLSAAPKIVDFEESAPLRTGEAHTVDFAAPAGMAVDAERLELHQKAVAYAQANNVSYEVALGKVS
jgi:hypothetical protein